MISLDELKRIKEIRKTSLYYAEKEYLQYIFLNSLSKYAEHFAFKGGTCLRIAYEIERASEDIDFNTDFSVKDIKKIVPKLLKDFEYLNIPYDIYAEKMFEGNYANFQRYGSPTPPAQSQRPEYTSGNAPAQQRPAPAPAGGGSFLDKIFSGKDYQSSGGQLQQQQGGNRVLNWGDSDNAADFFRADAMRKRMEDQKQQFTGESGSDIDYRNRMAASQAESEGKARGGAAQQKPSKEAMLHKSLEIIHHMIKNR